MTSGLTIVGKRDAKLEELVRASGQVTTVTWLTDLSTLVDAKAAQPDVLLVDVRQGGGVPPQLATLKRQHPATNVVLLAATLDPTVMLEGMRAGVSECIAEPLRQDDVNAALTRLLGQQAKGPDGPVFAFVGAKGGVGTTTTAVNVATTLAKLSSGNALLIDLHLAYGDAAVFLGADARFSVLDALENLHRLDVQFLKSLVCRTASRLDLLASADRPATRLLDVRAPWLRDPARRVAVRLHRPRRPQVGSDGARQPRRRRQPRRGRQPGTGHRSECRPHGGGHASAIPEDERHDRHQPYGRSFGDQSTGCRKSRGRQRSPTRSPATTAVRCWRCTKAGRSRSTITISSRRHLPRSRGIWQGSKTRKPTAPQRAVSRDFCPDAVNHSEAKDSIA